MIPHFRTERLLLKGVEESDAPAYESHFVDYEVIQNLAAGVPWPYPKGEILNYIRTRILPFQGQDKWTWGIYLQTNPSELIGVVDLWRPGHPENRGFWLGKKYWGRGIMTEAVKPVMDFAFESLGFEKLVFANAVGNLKSRRVKEKTGCRLVSVEPAKFVNPKFTEHEIWELNKSDWIKS